MDHLRKSDAIYASLGSNERAIVDRIRISLIRRSVIRLIDIKMRLQFTGWLQYLLPLPIVIILVCLSALAYLSGLYIVANFLTFFFLVFFAVILFDIVTCRFRIRFPEPLPKARTGDDVFTLMRARRSVRSYQTKTLTREHEQALQASIATHLSESRFGHASIRLEWVRAPIIVWPVVNARQFLVAIAPAKYNRTAILDIGRVLQKIVIDATRLGLGTCWIGPGADHNSVRSHLGERFDGAKDAIICLCAVGYKSWYTPLFIRFFNIQSHKRLPLSQLFFDEEMARPLTPTAAPWIAYNRVFESCQWAPSSYNGQTTRCIVRQVDDGQCVDFYANTSSRYYAALATGIWCGNWEMGCRVLGFEGEFQRLSIGESNAEKQNDIFLHYDISWMSA